MKKLTLISHALLTITIFSNTPLLHASAATPPKDYIRKKARKKATCPLCNKVFYSKYTLQTHLITHTREAPFSCPECNKSFNNKSNLLRHRRTIHALTKQYLCPYCSKEYTWRTELEKHIREKHIPANADTPLPLQDSDPMNTPPLSDQNPASPLDPLLISDEAFTLLTDLLRRQRDDLLMMEELEETQVAELLSDLSDSQQELT